MPILLFFLSFLLSSSFALSDEYKQSLTVHHFLSPSHILQTKLLEPLSDDLAKKSLGQLSLSIYPSMALGGKPQDLFAQVRDGSVDIAWSLIGYTPGLFPRSEVFELPGVHKSSALATSLAMLKLKKDLLPDFKDVKLLFLHAHDGNSLHTVSHQVSDIKDLRGLKLRTPSRTGAWMISSWGASPVAMPLPSLPQALSRKNIDGALLPFEVMPSIGAEKLTQHSYLLPEKQRFGTAVFMLIMNKKRFLSLPPHLQKLISQETSEKRITDISNAWQNGEELGIQAQKDSGGTVSILSQNTAETFISRFRDVSDRWIDEVNARDINGQELLKKAKNAVLHYENNP